MSLQILDFPGDSDHTRQDQTRLDQTRLVLHPIRTLTTFFKVKSVNLVFSNYILVYLQVSVFHGDSKSFFHVLQEALQECIKGNVIVYLVSPEQC